MARINYEKLSMRVCEYCKIEYTPSGPAQQACKVCRKHLDSLINQVKRDVVRYSKFNTYDFVGKGYSSKRGKESHSYKNGIGYFHSVLSKRAKKLRYCQECGKDLIGANRYQWIAHHIDHNRDHNEWENITLLCKRCHQLEHECWKAFN